MSLEQPSVLRAFAINTSVGTTGLLAAFQFTNFVNKKHPTSARKDFNLTGTTLRIYRLLYIVGMPLGLSEIQRVAGLSSHSVAHYHVSKLLSYGLIVEKEGAYVVEKQIFENMIRVRRSLIPLQTTFALFFGTTLVGLILFLKLETFQTIYLFAFVTNLIALGIFVYQTIDTLKKFRTDRVHGLENEFESGSS